MVEFTDVSKEYEPGIVALQNVSLKVDEGEFVSIVGQSGTGKSTLIKLIIGEEQATSGDVVVDGMNLSTLRPRQLPLLRQRIGVVFQDFKLLPNRTVAENVAFALEARGEPRHRIDRVVPQVLELVRLEDKANRYPTQLSGGEQQRVVIARSLVNQPKLVVADEPTGNLDGVNAREIIELLQRINELGSTVILVTHNREIVNALRRRVVTLDSGQVVGDQAVGRYVL
jgi:cell division transport system ATP-binding protein